MNLHSNQIVLFWLTQKMSYDSRQKKNKKQKISEAKTRGCFHRAAKSTTFHFIRFEFVNKKLLLRRKLKFADSFLASH